MERKKRDANVQSYFERKIREFEAAQQFATARHYRSTSNSLFTFCGESSLRFSQINHDFVLSYNLWLIQRGLCQNSVSFYNRVLRALCHSAAEDGICLSENIFCHLNTKVAPTRKRAVEAKVLQRVKMLDLSASPSLDFARDLFLFSFMAQGMAFVDLAYLKYENIGGGEIHYFRHKTGCEIRIFLEPEMWRIIRRRHSPASDYVFPLLSAEDAHTVYRQYQNKLAWYNFCLRKLSEKLGLKNGLSSYVARHSWATQALRCHIPVGIISQAMGHSNERTTTIYLDRLKMPVIAKANRRIINRLSE